MVPLVTISGGAVGGLDPFFFAVLSRFRRFSRFIFGVSDAVGRRSECALKQESVGHRFLSRNLPPSTVLALITGFA